MHRIALVVPAFPKLSESFIVSKFAGLLDRGWDVHVVCRRRGEDWNAFRELRPETAHRVHVARPAQPRWKAAALTPAAVTSTLIQQTKVAARYLRRGNVRDLYLDEPLIALRPDLIHFEFGTLAPERMHLKALLGSKIVISFRGFDLNFVGLDDSGYYDAVWARADAIHTLGSDLWGRAQRRGCPASMPHALIPPAIDVDFFQRGRQRYEGRVGTKDRPLQIVSVGRLAWKKGYEYAFEAVRNLIDRGIHCRHTVVGDGEYVTALAFARHQLGLEDIVEFAGPLPRGGVRSCLEDADVMLHAAVSEGFCNAVLEAQAMNVPVVTSDADGLAENVLDGETGFVVERRNARALADKLQILATDAETRIRLGSAGRRRVVEQFRIEDQIDLFDDLYRRVLGGTLRGQPIPQDASNNMVLASS